ncbi:hypothetical protein C8F04DRAFT_1177815 [Mycena alexandri]|uniref:Uncharacterized protein n=1 Tax=Mycena alexandri TaxID=1745969 RepID=A0AAD6X8R6_9AGAR|nr:hypothetical protein C8F04DRAFT_1177815 [Mycena alexandri]
MVNISAQETRRLFGPVNQPHSDNNVRHNAVLRKAIELYTAEELAEIFGRPISLRAAMGSAYTFYQLGKIRANLMINGRLVRRETDPPSLDARHHLLSYRNAGNTYAIRNVHAKAALEAAEQVWHDWIVAYLAAHGIPGRADWALQPLPGLRRVRIAPAPAPFAPAPARAAMNFLGFIDISDDEDIPRVATASTRARVALPTPPPSSPAPTHIDLSQLDEQPARLPTPPPSSPAPTHIDLSQLDEQPARPAVKRKFLGVVEISDDDEEDASRPPKKARSLGYLELTN